MRRISCAACERIRERPKPSAVLVTVEPLDDRPIAEFGDPPVEELREAVAQEASPMIGPA
jgi:hypothetical protein